MTSLDVSVTAVLQAMLHDTNPFVREIKVAAGCQAPDLLLRIAAGQPRFHAGPHIASLLLLSNSNIAAGSQGVSHVDCHGGS